MILIVAIGPWLWLRPSARERRLARLRQAAYRQGMRVELRRLPGRDVDPQDRVTAGGRVLDTGRECAAYLSPLPQRLRHLPSWRLLRGESDSAAPPGWGFEPGKRPDGPLAARAIDAVAAVAAVLPDDVVALQCEPLNVAGYWLEGPGTTAERVDDLATQLAAAGRALADLDARVGAESEPGNI